MTTILERLIDQQAVPRAPASQVASLWQIVVGPNNVGPQYELSQTTNRQLVFHVDDSSTLQFTLLGSDPAAQYITELVTDAWVYRNGVLVDRYRIGSSQDDIDGETDTYTIQFSCFDYREWMGRQLLQPGRIWSWRNVPQSKVVNDLISLVITGQSGIQPGPITVDTSKLPGGNINYDQTIGASVREAIGTLSGMGFQVIPNSTLGLTVRCISPWYYNLNNHFVLNFGGTISKVTRSFDTGAFADSAIYTGDMNLQPIQRDATGIASAPQGRLGITGSNPAIVDTAHLAAAATNFATISQNVVPTWTCQLAVGAWQSISDAWLGDICQFVVNKGRVNVNDQYRITDITITVSDDSETADVVSLTLAKPPYVPSS